MTMEEKATELLDNCVRIVCELPVGDPEIVREATAGKLHPASEPSDEDRDQVKILVPVLQWLLAPPPKKSRKKKKAAAKTSGGDSKKGGVRKKKGAGKKDPPKDPPDGGEGKDDLPV
jgi:hypothetical protein